MHEHVKMHVYMYDKVKHTDFWRSFVMSICITERWGNGVKNGMKMHVCMYDKADHTGFWHDMVTYKNFDQGYVAVSFLAGDVWLAECLVHASAGWCVYAYITRQNT